MYCSARNYKVFAQMLLGGRGGKLSFLPSPENEASTLTARKVFLELRPLLTNARSHRMAGSWKDVTVTFVSLIS